MTLCWICISEWLSGNGFTKTRLIFTEERKFLVAYWNTMEHRIRMSKRRLHDLYRSFLPNHTFLVLQKVQSVLNVAHSFSLLSCQRVWLQEIAVTRTITSKRVDLFAMKLRLCGKQWKVENLFGRRKKKILTLPKYEWMNETIFYTKERKKPEVFANWNSPDVHFKVLFRLEDFLSVFILCYIHLWFVHFLWWGRAK